MCGDSGSVNYEEIVGQCEEIVGQCKEIVGQ